MPRQLTKEEVKQNFLKYLKAMAVYWANLPGKTDLERTQGAIFSVLTAIDGEAGALPAFCLVPASHPDNKEFMIKQGKNWYPILNVNCDIGGNLHEEFLRTWD